MGYGIKKTIEIIKNLIFVPKCVSCGERLSPIPEKGNLTYDKVCFCQKCGTEWERARAEMCPVCSNISEKCHCTPKFFDERQPSIPSVCFYHPEEEDVASKTVLYMKHVNNSDLFDFTAIELFPKIKTVLNKMGIDGKNCIFTWTPRKRSSVTKYGFDQGKEIAIRTAKLFGGECYPLFLRFGGKEQKTLDRNGRKKNAERAIILNNALLGFPYKRKEKELEEFITGKNVIIIDDVLTSGSTLKQGVLLLESERAERVIVACIAKSARRDKK